MDVALYVDTAALTEIEQALRHPWLSGVTTNPTLVARALNAASDSRIPTQSLTEEGLYAEILSLLRPDQRLYIQVRGSDPEDLVLVFKRWWRLAEGRLVAKLPATWAGLDAANRIKTETGAPVCVTAVFSAAQAYAAALAGADQIAVYVSRYAKNRSEPALWLTELREVLNRSGKAVRILAASIKSPPEAAEALVAGADDLTLPMGVLESLMEDPLTSDALRGFDEDWRQRSTDGIIHPGA